VVDGFAPLTAMGAAPAVSGHGELPLEHIAESRRTRFVGENADSHVVDSESKRDERRVEYVLRTYGCIAGYIIAVNQDIDDGGAGCDGWQLHGDHGSRIDDLLARQRVDDASSGARNLADVRRAWRLCQLCSGWQPRGGRTRGECYSHSAIAATNAV